MSFKNFNFRDHSFFLVTHTETYHYLQYGNLPGKEYEIDKGKIKATVKNKKKSQFYTDEFHTAGCTNKITQ